MKTIEHNGQTFTQLGWANTEFGKQPVWSIDEYLARTNHTKTEQIRIRALNRCGKPEMMKPRGWTGPIPHKPKIVKTS
jgi:hypothetical protein